MNDCLFCMIVDGKIPSLKVFEDEHVLAFMDINPVNVGHTLVVPKTHSTNCGETSDDDLANVFVATKRIGAAAIAATGATAYNIGVNCGEDAGQLVMHTHVHVIPRFKEDGLHLWPKGAVTREQIEHSAAAIAEKLRPA